MINLNTVPFWQWFRAGVRELERFGVLDEAISLTMKSTASVLKHMHTLSKHILGKEPQ